MRRCNALPASIVRRICLPIGPLPTSSLLRSSTATATTMCVDCCGALPLGAVYETETAQAVLAAPTTPGRPDAITVRHTSLALARLHGDATALDVYASSPARPRTGTPASRERGLHGSHDYLDALWIALNAHRSGHW